MIDPVSNDSLSGYPYQLARDCLSGDVRDYVFFATSPDQYYLVLSYDIQGITYEGNCDYYDIQHIYPVDASDYWNCTYVTDAHINIYNPNNYMVYSSEAGTPDLRGGTEKYAFFICVLGVGCCCWCLLYHIFKRFY